jgi:S1-C subfamily serine protease/tetratricopeptide (TPR) repeat protein
MIAMCRFVAVVFSLACSFLPAPVFAQQDLRVRYGTDSVQAAQAIQRGLGLMNMGKDKESIPEFEAALKTDPNCGFAMFQLAMAQGAAGNIESAMEQYKKLFGKDVKTGRNVRAVAATNMGLINAKLGNIDESTLWFSKAIVEDYDNTFKERAKAYRNMALNLRDQKKHFPAAIAVALAYEDKAQNCDINMVRDFFKQVKEEEDSCVLLRFEDDQPLVTPRKEPIDLTPIKIDNIPTDRITEFLPDPAGKYVVALSPAAGKYFVVGLGATPNVKAVEATGLVAGCLMEGKLFLSRKSPDRIDQVEIDTGKQIKSYAMAKSAPTSFTVFPAQNHIYFCQDDAVHDYDMSSGNSKESNTPGTVVAGHPNQKYVFSFYRPKQQGGSGLVVVDGRVFEVRRGTNWLQCPLFKSVATPGGLLLAEVRDNAASNGQQLMLSSDGNWVGVAGGGGYRPSDKKVGGYGVAVFNSTSTEKLQGFFKTDAYPLGVAVNHVNGVVVGVRGQDFHLSHLSDPSSATKTVKGDWAGPCTWSGDGRILLLAHAKGGGFSAYSTTLTAEEQKLASTWPSKIKVVPMGPGAKRPAVATPIQELGTFSVPVAPNAESLRKLIDQVEATGRSAVISHWANHPAYEAKQMATQEIANVIKILRAAKAEDLGIALVRLQRADKATPNHPPLLFFMGQTHLLRDQKEEAEKFLLAAVRGDSGRSDVTMLGLGSLSILYERKGEPLRGIYCLLTALRVDRADPKVIGRASDALVKAKLIAESDRVRKFAAAPGPAPDAPLTAIKEMPSLVTGKNGKKMTSEELYAKSAPSVVVIRTSAGNGSGVCVGRGDIILTNAHVVERGGDVAVHTYRMNGKKLERGPELKGKVVHRSDIADLAIVQLDKVALSPLTIGGESPAAGAKVFALGSPGLGASVLEQSISEGLVSSPTRKVDGRLFIQHSAAINPGNSGGPLIDEYGNVVGIVTLKAKLENVGFAVPVETFRQLFPEAKK